MINSLHKQAVNQAGGESRTVIMQLRDEETLGFVYRVNLIADHELNWSKLFNPPAHRLICRQKLIFAGRSSSQAVEPTQYSLRAMNLILAVNLPAFLLPLRRLNAERRRRSSNGTNQNLGSPIAASHAKNLKLAGSRESFAH